MHAQLNDVAISRLITICQDSQDNCDKVEIRAKILSKRLYILLPSDLNKDSLPIMHFSSVVFPHPDGPNSP